MDLQIRNLSQLTGVGVLGDRDRTAQSLGFLRFNLIYGFNGSGKSTLSRVFASAQSGQIDPALPDNCTFEFELENGSYLSSTNLAGLEKHILVFNADFIDRNLQWTKGLARPVFYIGREQAEAAAELATKETQLQTHQKKIEEAKSGQQAAERSLSIFRRERAKLISEQGGFSGRAYEARHLEQDFAAFKTEDDTLLSEAEIDSARVTSRLDGVRSLPELAAVSPLKKETFDELRVLISETPGTTILKDLEKHPDMLLWVKRGFEYHRRIPLDICLFCDNPISAERLTKLEQTFDDRLERFLERIKICRTKIENKMTELNALVISLHHPTALLGKLVSKYSEARDQLGKAADEARALTSQALDIVTRKGDRPTQQIEPSDLADSHAVKTALERLQTAINDLNLILQEHNEQAKSFQDYKLAARLSLRKHYVSEARNEHEELASTLEEARLRLDTAHSENDQLRHEIDDLIQRVREHGTAAEKINKLISLYLGHNELKIIPISEGYEIQRHGRRLDGPPSEGEKTAIALCYFLSTLESDGRKIREAILVIDDPISSLDTKALNYACALVKSGVDKAAQVFILTHNLPCMNEFKKAWRKRVKPDDPSKPATARLLFLDVRRPREAAMRKTAITEMSKLLREYDFEYHFLIKHVFDFEAKGLDYDYAYMMPNVLRRVLDVFLAFKCPGSAGLAEKINQLCGDHELDPIRLKALDRLAQFESHSDSLDDLLEFSSMTVEEALDATKLLLEVMHKSDPSHTDRLLNLCR
jgi:wobble nucleotide-excising tRNase